MRTKHRVTNDQLLEDLHRVAREYHDLRSHNYGRVGRYSVATFYGRFGTWRKTLQAALRYRESGIVLKAAKAALGGCYKHGALRSARIAEEEEHDRVPFYRWTHAQVEARWPRRMYGEIPRNAQQKEYGLPAGFG